MPILCLLIFFWVSEWKCFNSFSSWYEKVLTACVSPMEVMIITVWSCSPDCPHQELSWACCNSPPAPTLPVSVEKMSRFFVVCWTLPLVLMSQWLVLPHFFSRVMQSKPPSLNPTPPRQGSMPVGHPACTTERLLKTFHDWALCHGNVEPRTWDDVNWCSSTDVAPAYTSWKYGLE